MIVMDAMEKEKMQSMVKKECKEVKMGSGFGGDYMVGEWIIERKTWKELPGRMTDSENDLYFQLSKLMKSAKEAGLTPVLILEGEPSSAVRYSDLPVIRIVQYLAGAHKIGVHTTTTPNHKCTAALLAKLEDEEEFSVIPSRNAAPVPVELMPRWILEGFRGIGPNTAARLLDEFGSAKAVINASSDELQTVKGIGPATAREIVEMAEMNWEG